MENKEIILSNISNILKQKDFLLNTNSSFKSILKCIGLGEYFEKYSKYLTPYYFSKGNTCKFKNTNEEYDVFLGLDSIFTDLYHEQKNGEIIALLKELTKLFNVEDIKTTFSDDLKKLANFYELLGLSISIKCDKVIVTAYTKSNEQRVTDLFSVENWLKQNHEEGYTSYKSAIDAYVQGHAGACIECCRTCLVSVFEKYRGPDDVAKWIRGAYNISGDSSDFDLKDLTKALRTEICKNDLADFFYENRAGKLTKTKTIYMIYSMMSDYGTHRNEEKQEKPTLEDALLSFRLLDSILFWVYSRKR